MEGKSKTWQERWEENCVACHGHPKRNFLIVKAMAVKRTQKMKAVKRKLEKQK